MVAKAPPDGYLIGLGGAAGLGISLGAQENVTYDARKDLAPVTGLASVPFILAASSSLGRKSLRDIIAMAKEPKLVIGYGGNGTLMHLTAEMFNQMADTRIELVPYRGMALQNWILP
jgi:tripartite-type tricarboxylate transporter receptor subunit TctC